MVAAWQRRLLRSFTTNERLFWGYSLFSVFFKYILPIFILKIVDNYDRKLLTEMCGKYIMKEANENEPFFVHAQAFEQVNGVRRKFILIGCTKNYALKTIKRVKWQTNLICWYDFMFMLKNSKLTVGFPLFFFFSKLKMNCSLRLYRIRRCKQGHFMEYTTA